MPQLRFSASVLCEILRGRSMVYGPESAVSAVRVPGRRRQARLVQVIWSKIDSQ
jgi:hypothetical protein